MVKESFDQHFVLFPRWKNVLLFMLSMASFLVTIATNSRQIFCKTCLGIYLQLLKTADADIIPIGEKPYGGWGGIPPPLYAQEFVFFGIILANNKPIQLGRVFESPLTLTRD